ncbi:hypothetical protein vBVpaMR16F_35 [Vibrio phage vB_VpaM_R16F]|nr:hypothetical protein vBVpaMR16F_35 [Vibrio phage vB_VpaM_R16F]
MIVVNSKGLTKNGWVIIGKKDSGNLQCTRCKKIQSHLVESYTGENTIEPCSCREGWFLFVSVSF